MSFCNFFLCFLVYPKGVHPYRMLEGYTNKWGTPESSLQQECGPGWQPGCAALAASALSKSGWLLPKSAVLD